MHVPREPLAVQQAVERLAEILNSVGSAEAVWPQARADNHPGWKAVLQVNGRRFGLVWKRAGTVSAIASTVHALGASPRSGDDHKVIPLLAVPHMGDAAQELCAQADLAWLDLSGNARIVVHGIFYQNLGSPSRYRRAGRPESAFGPRGSRVARLLLMEPPGTLRQREIAARTGLNEGHVSRVVGKLLADRLVERNDDGISVPDGGMLLDAWRDDYRFDRHSVIRGHIAARDGASLIHSIAECLEQVDLPYAATGLSAAWMQTRHAGFRLATAYLSTQPSAGLQHDLRFREEDRGANTWLVVPNDDGVFDGAEPVDGVRCVHPVQAYIDLKGHPERAAEAAQELRRVHLGTIWQ